MARKVAQPFIEQTLECSDRCNCKGFGARSQIRTDDLLFTSHSRMVVGAGRALYPKGFGPVDAADTTSYRAITPGFVAPMWPEKSERFWVTSRGGWPPTTGDLVRRVWPARRPRSWAGS